MSWTCKQCGDQAEDTGRPEPMRCVKCGGGYFFPSHLDEGACVGSDDGPGCLGCLLALVMAVLLIGFAWGLAVELFCFLFLRG